MPSVLQAVLAALGVVSLTVLVALGKVSSDVAVPILTAFVGGGLGHVNGAAQAKQAP